MIADKYWIVIVCILSFFCIADAKTEEQLIRFPGERSEITSPSGKYILYNVNNEHYSPHHVLFLKDVIAKTEEKLLSYSRFAEVAWSPSGNALIINDHGGSDYTNCIVFLFGKEKKIIKLKEFLRQKIGDNKSIFKNHHVYIEGMKWLSENKVKIKISGYGNVDPEGFILWYEYTIGDGFRFIKKENRK